MTALSPVLAPSFKDLVALTKPRITLMTIVVAGGSMLLASGDMVWHRAVLALLGIGLLVSGSSAFNMYIERDLDALMTRTQDRPLPSGRMQPIWALALGWLLSLAAIPALVLGTNTLTAALGVFSLISYVLIYTPMKRLSCLALVVGAVPGAMPALMGYTAASGELDQVGITLFGVAFLWQLPHFIAISIFRKDEYTRAGYPVVAEVAGIFAAKVLTVFTTVLIVINSLLLYALDVGGLLYGICSAALGIWFLVICCLGLVSHDVDAWAKKVFYASLIYQLLLFAALALDVSLQRLF